jgi:hypothetical protein
MLVLIVMKMSKKFDELMREKTELLKQLRSAKITLGQDEELIQKQLEKVDKKIKNRYNELTR